MKKEQIEKMSFEELVKKTKTYKMATIVLSVLVLIMFVTSFFSYQENGVSFSVFLPLFFLPMVLTNRMTFLKLQKELKSRQKD
ncbi:hypothetical protein [Jejuia spongiicola]|uniref:Redox-active disulfide protein 2 n=1 Tax=Jejuia spongiicola TaxID=2942207 RepID=A0ABT0QEV8_9FLAO|nr:MULTISPECIES: hypothetical protein [Flavobacteriaceae]MCL6295475.1 hypothetical protein [Jejuia spongiicola]